MTVEPTAPPPRANPELVGHEAVEAALQRQADIGRLPHALLLSGPRGIGKATLAFRLARYVLAVGEGNGIDASLDTFGGPAPRRDTGLAVPPESGVFRRVAAGGHADLLTIERAYDSRRKRLRGEIVVDEVREIGTFLHLTAAEGGWRVVIVDGADEMNRSAANSLLKILEEPPRHALLILVAQSLGKLLPTVRSRCRHMALAPLSSPILHGLLACYCPTLEEPESASVAEMSQGSIGRALELIASGGIELQKTLNMLTRRGGTDALALHGFADRLARADAEDAYRTVGDLLRQDLASRAVGAARENLRAAAARWVDVRTQVEREFARTDGLNLDKKQTIMNAIFAINAAAEAG